MTRSELEHVKKVLLRIKPKEDGELHGKVKLAIVYVEKDIALREAQKDNFKDMFESDFQNF